MRIFNSEKNFELLDDIRELNGRFEQDEIAGERVLIFYPEEEAVEIQVQAESIKEESVIQVEEVRAVDASIGAAVEGLVEYSRTDKSLEVELGDIIDWFVDNDWKCNKVFLGEWDANDPRFLEYKHARLIKRSRQDEIRRTLKNNNKEEENNVIYR